MSRKRRDEHREPAIENRPYDAQGSKAEAEATDKDDGFRRGGKAKARRRKRGGASARAQRADGARPHARADKPRRARGGRSPMSRAAGPKMRPGMDSSAGVDKEAD